MESFFTPELIYIPGIVLWFSTLTLITLIIFRKNKKKDASLQRKAGAVPYIWILLTKILAGSTGVVFILEWEVWNEISHVGYWWLHSMILTWILYCCVFFLIDPIIGNRSS